MSEDLQSYFDSVKLKWSNLGGVGKSVIAIAGFGIGAIALLWSVDRITLFFFARSYVDEIAKVFNLDKHFSQAFALVIWIITLFLIAKLFSFSKTNRQIGFYGLVALFVSQALLLSYGSKRQYFEASSGKAIKCYVLTRQGEVRYLEHPGVDPETGRICREYTQETAERLQAYASGQRPERILAPEPDFFDPRSGEPIVWYYKDKDGWIEIFNLMGFHPESGEELLPVNPEIIKAYKNQAQRKIAPPQRINDIEAFQLFDTASGRPRVWFWRGSNGEYEFFDNQGFHPGTGAPLKQFTSDEIARWRHEKQLAKEFEEQEETKRLQLEQLRKDAEERRLAREHEAAERVEKAETEKQKKIANAVETCDRLAANPNDREKPTDILGARFAEVRENVDEAIISCRTAAGHFPESLRYKYQYARALGFKKPDEAIAIYRNLTKRLYPAAFDNLASLLLQRRDKNSIREALLVLKDGVRNGDTESMITLAALAGTAEFPVQNPYSYKFMLYKQAANLGNQNAKETVDELERQTEQQRQEYISRRQEEQMMLDLFGSIVGGALRGR